MRWRGGRESENVEDRRGMPGGPVAIGGIGILVIILLAAFLGIDPRPLLQQQQQGGPMPGPQAPAEAGVDDELKQFVRVVLADTEDVWREQFREQEMPAEVAVAGKAAIFVPFPQAADDHQRKNAEAFVRAGAGRMILETELDGERVARELETLMDDPKAIDEMEEASRRLARADATERTVDLAVGLARK